MKKIILWVLVMVLVLTASPVMAAGAGISTKAIAYRGKVYSSYSALTVNKGRSRVLATNFIKDSEFDVPSRYRCTGFKSSNSKVAKVSSKGVVTGVAAGSAVITCTSKYSRTPVTVAITVPSKRVAAGSAYIKMTGKFPLKQLLGSPLMVAGSENRINGTLISDENMKSLTVKFVGASGKVGTTFRKSISGKSLTLAKLQREIPFSKLKTGSKGIRVYVKNTLGTALVYSDGFEVISRAQAAALPGAARGEFIARAAISRGNDPYSSANRGSLNFVDASYLTWWAYRQAGITGFPNTAAAQYKYCVDHKKTITKANLQPGDLVYFGGKPNGRYKNIYNCVVYLGGGLGIGPSTPAVDYVPIAGPKGTKFYYGRPV